MEGTIKIEALHEGVWNMDCEMRKVSRMDKLRLFDSLAKVLEMDAEERYVIGMTIAVGGMEVISGVAPTMVKFDKKMMELLKEKGSNDPLD